jgi:hypothetical protein
MPYLWNSPQLNGRVNSGDGEVDFGSVIPSSLLTADIPDIAALIAPRKVLFCQARDAHSAGNEILAARFRRITVDYRPDTVFDARLLLDWIGQDRP